MSRHTPGPWSAHIICYSDDGISSFSHGEVRDDAKNKLIAKIPKQAPYYDEDPAEGSKITHLIAAAPEMLERLRAAKDILESVVGDVEDDHPLQEEINEIERVIAKARGGK